MTPIEYHNPNDYWQGYDPYKGMSDKERLKAGCLQVLGIVGGFIAALLICALFGSCTTTQYVPVVEHRTDTLLKYSSIRDSIYVHDSIRVSEKGDTVRIERWRTKYVEKQVHDTIYQSSTDSVPKPYPVVKVVERELTTNQKGLMTLGALALMAFVVYVVFKLKHFIL